LNPSVLNGIVPAGYPLHVPKGSGTDLTAGLEMVPPEHRDSWRMHRLGIGETVADVSRRYGISLTSLTAANNLQSRQASEGDRLVIPAMARPELVSRRSVGRGGAAHRTVASVSSSKARTPAARPAARPKSKPPVIAATTAH
jgi:membrane-bound lytic murein transglycosylase D